MPRTKAPTTAAAATTRTTRATSKAKEPSAVPTTTKATQPRKPLANRANTVVVEVPTLKPRKKVAPQNVSDNDEREPIMAYLRIRPHLGSEPSPPQPYLTHISDSAVRMTDPAISDPSSSRFRASTITPSLSSSVYTFSHVFPPATSQSDFFVKTTLPLVGDVLGGQNALLFTYGVTNSGKTFTVQGGTTPDSAGILPRTLDVIFNSIEGLHGDGKLRPVRLNGVELTDPADSVPSQAEPSSAFTSILALESDDASATDTDPTVLSLDRNYEYTVWLSYAEVYNEKTYDLLDSVASSSNASAVPRSAVQPMSFVRKALALRSSPDSDGSDTPGKYIASLSHHRIHTAAEAKSLLRLGQLHRRVFGTLANAVSSRSHAIVTIKILRMHRGERHNPTAVQVSRLTLVDLAGSERTKLAGTSGERLKEAGSINKSLMVLGQCLETLRNNQRRVAASLARGVGDDANGRADTREVKRRLSVVPFRHSRLTEVLMDYFAGDGGRTVMIVNVNPYDTGYDENAHVMRFAALAKEVYVSPTQAAVQRFPGVAIASASNARKTAGENSPPGRTTRKVMLETIAGHGRKPSQAILEVVEEDPEEDGTADCEGDEGDAVNPLVDALFEEVERLRMQLFDCELKCAVIEAETREEVMHEMEERMRAMERVYARRLMSEVKRNEMKTDAKIDFLHQSGLFGSPVKSPVKAHLAVDEFDEYDSIDVDGTQEHDPDGDWIPDSPSLGSKMLIKGKGVFPHGRPILAAALRDESELNYVDRITSLEESLAVVNISGAESNQRKGPLNSVTEEDDDEANDEFLTKKAKPKRKLGAKHVVTEAEMALAANNVDKASNRNIRRLTGKH